MSYTERFKAIVGDAYTDRRLAVERGKMLEYDLTERHMKEAEARGEDAGYWRKQLPAFEEKIKTIWLPYIERVMVQVRHEREVEKAREEQGFAKAREEAMAAAVVDLSRVFGERHGERHGGTEGRVEATGLGMHQAVGEQSVRAKLTDETAQQIRREYWASGEPKGTGGGGVVREAGLASLGKKYGVSKTAILFVLRRRTWVHLPRVEGEPEENLKGLSETERRVAKKAKALGVEPVRSELGRIALPPDVVAKLRAESYAKREATKAKKKSAAKE